MLVGFFPQQLQKVERNLNWDAGIPIWFGVPATAVQGEREKKHQRAHNMFKVTCHFRIRSEATASSSRLVGPATHLLLHPRNTVEEEVWSRTSSPSLLSLPHFLSCPIPLFCFREQTRKSCRGGHITRQGATHGGTGGGICPAASGAGRFGVCPVWFGPKVNLVLAQVT